MNNEMNFELHFIIRGSQYSWHSIFNYGDGTTLTDTSYAQVRTLSVAAGRDRKTCQLERVETIE